MMYSKEKINKPTGASSATSAVDPPYYLGLLGQLHLQS
jgi:hypothetical protein